MQLDALLAAVEVDGLKVAGRQRIQVLVMHARRELQAHCPQAPPELGAAADPEQQPSGVLLA